MPYQPQNSTGVGAIHNAGILASPSKGSYNGGSAPFDPNFDITELDTPLSGGSSIFSLGNPLPNAGFQIEPFFDQPTTDDFNRADAATLGANYGFPIRSSGTTWLQVVSNMVQGTTAAANNEAYWNTSLPADQQISAEYRSDSDMRLYLRIVSPGVAGTWAAYELQILNSVIKINEFALGAVNFIPVQNFSPPIPFAVGHRIGFRITSTGGGTGAYLDVFQNIGDGEWRPVFRFFRSAVPAVLQGGGFAGMLLFDNSTSRRLDNVALGAALTSSTITYSKSGGAASVTSGGGTRAINYAKSPGAGGEIGNSQPGSIVDSGYAGARAAMQVTLGAAADIEEIAVWLNAYSTVAPGRVAIYADNAGAPGNRLFLSADITPIANARQQLKFPLNASLAAGTYWLAVGFDAQTGIDLLVSSGTHVYNFSSGALVDPFGSITTDGAHSMPIVAYFDGVNSIASGGGIQNNFVGIAKSGGATSVASGGGTRAYKVARSSGAISVTSASGTRTVRFAKSSGAISVTSANGTRAYRVARSSGAISVASANGIKGFALARSGGAISIASGGGSKGFSQAKNAGAVSPASGGGTRATRVARAAGAVSPASGGGTRAFSYSRASGAISVASANGTRFIRYAKASGGISAGSSNGTKAARFVKSSGAVAIASGGGSKIASTGQSKAGGAISILSANGTKTARFVKASGAISITSANGTRAYRISKVSGAVVITSGGGSWVYRISKTAGAISPGSGGGANAFRISKLGGGLSTLTSNGSGGIGLGRFGGSISIARTGGVGGFTIILNVIPEYPGHRLVSASDGKAILTGENTQDSRLLSTLTTADILAATKDK